MNAIYSITKSLSKETPNILSLEEERTEKAIDLMPRVSSATQTYPVIWVCPREPCSLCYNSKLTKLILQNGPIQSGDGSGSSGHTSEIITVEAWGRDAAQSTTQNGSSCRSSMNQ